MAASSDLPAPGAVLTDVLIKVVVEVSTVVELVRRTKWLAVEIR